MKNENDLIKCVEILRVDEKSFRNYIRKLIKEELNNVKRGQSDINDAVWKCKIEDYVNNDKNNKFCIAQIWEDCLGKEYAPTKTDSNLIAKILDGIDSIYRKNTSRFGKKYGSQKAWVKI